MAISKTKIRFLFETIIRKSFHINIENIVDTLLQWFNVLKQYLSEFNFPAYDRIFTKITEVAYLSENSICTIEGKFRISIV